MLAVDESVLETKQVVVVVLVQLAVELRATFSGVKAWRTADCSYQIEHGHLHHALVEVGGPILDHLDGHNLLGLQILALDHLSKGALSQHIKDQISIPAASGHTVISMACGETGPSTGDLT